MGRTIRMTRPLSVNAWRCAGGVQPKRVRTTATGGRALGRNKDGELGNISTSYESETSQKAVVEVPVRGKSQKNKAMPQGVKKALVLAATAVLLTSTVAPEDSLAARSGGRAGGRAFRSAPRAPRTSRTYSSRPRYGGGVYTAPPLVGGYGYPLFAPPMFFFPLGGIFQLFFLV